MYEVFNFLVLGNAFSSSVIWKAILPNVLQVIACCFIREHLQGGIVDYFVPLEGTKVSCFPFRANTKTQTHSTCES